METLAPVAPPVKVEPPADQHQLLVIHLMILHLRRTMMVRAMTQMMRMTELTRWVNTRIRRS